MILRSLELVRAQPNLPSFLFFFFNDTATTEIYPLPLHAALPICARPRAAPARDGVVGAALGPHPRDRKSTRLNSSHSQISYAVFCLKKKKKTNYLPTTMRVETGSRAEKRVVYIVWVSTTASIARQ